MTTEQHPAIKNTITTRQASKKAARMMFFGNIVALLIPFPLFIFWFGGSMLVFALNRHHPDPKVGYYTQIGAIYYYSLAGLVIPALSFIPKEFLFNHWFPIWILCAGIIIPLSLYQIFRINQDEWSDVKHHQ